jgi:hypothetical protein
MNKDCVFNFYQGIIEEYRHSIQHGDPVNEEQMTFDILCAIGCIFNYIEESKKTF